MKSWLFLLPRNLPHHQYQLACFVLRERFTARKWQVGLFISQKIIYRYPFSLWCTQGLPECNAACQDVTKREEMHVPHGFVLSPHHNLHWVSHGFSCASIVLSKQNRSLIVHHPSGTLPSPSHFFPVTFLKYILRYHGGQTYPCLLLMKNRGNLHIQRQSTWLSSTGGEKQWRDVDFWAAQKLLCSIYKTLFRGGRILD